MAENNDIRQAAAGNDEVKEVESVSSFLETTRTIQDRWKDNNSDFKTDPWFRGVPKHWYELAPSFHRLEIEKDGVITKASVIDKADEVCESDLRDEFMRKALPLLRNRSPQNKWDWYFLMQHYEVPTRLLDWSESSLVGLFFAVFDYGDLKRGSIRSYTDCTGQDNRTGRDDSMGTDAAVWMLDATSFNRLVHRDSEGESGKGKKMLKQHEPIPRQDSKVISKYLSNRPFDQKSVPAVPIALLPNHRNRRLTAQRGTFVLFGSDATPLEKVVQNAGGGGNILAKITIKNKSIPDIRRDLRKAGITPSLYLPELPFVSIDVLQTWCN